MKMVKSLLLGGAAAFAVTASAQAADLPVKAKPVQYVKICSLYGAGFYYIPGTDICLKVGGWTRFEYAYGSNGSFAWGPFNNNQQSRATNNSVFRARGYITADARSQTPYGTVRSYIAVGLSENDLGTGGNFFSANRAFIQWAGFTFGRASSFFDFYNVPATSYWGAFPASDTGDPGWMVAAYTAQFGGGFSATISAEQRRITTIVGPQGGDTGYGGLQTPDIVANLRIDQAWGSAQIMGALHQVNGGYYVSGIRASGHPGDKWGYAVGAGIKINAPMVSPGDYFQAQVNFAEGASRYVFSTPNSNWTKVDGANASLGLLNDGIFDVNTGVELTKTWGFNAAYEHFWNRQWKTSVYGGYAAVRYGDTATAFLCGVGCDANWSTWWLGSRTQWNVTKDLYMGLDVLYSKMTTMTIPLVTNLENQDNVAVRFRVHRDFMP